MYNRPGPGGGVGGSVRHELRLAPPPPGTGAEGVTAEGQAAARAELRSVEQQRGGVSPSPGLVRPAVCFLLTAATAAGVV